MTALNKKARLVSSARISEIANGANLIMGEKEWLANTAIYLANELKTATKAFQSTGFSLLEAEEKLEAAEKRIAELEAREILLPERSSMLHRTDFHDDYQTVMAYKVSEVIAAIRAAGIRIKGE